MIHWTWCSARILLKLRWYHQWRTAANPLWKSWALLDRRAWAKIVFHCWFTMCSCVSLSSNSFLILSFSSLRRWYSPVDLICFSFSTWSLASSASFHNEPTSMVFSVSLKCLSTSASFSFCSWSGGLRSLSRSIGEPWSDELSCLDTNYVNIQLLRGETNQFIICCSVTYFIKCQADFCDTYTECWVFHVLSTPCGLTYILAQC